MTNFIKIVVKEIIKKLKSLIPDSFFIRYDHYKFTGKSYNENNITSFSDRVCSWKLSDKLYDYSKYVDKFLVREFVTNTIGPNYLPKIIQVYKSPDEFSLECLPNEFVLKLNNGCGCNLVIRNKDEHNDLELKALIRKWLKYDYYQISREKQYKNVEPLVYCEELIESESGLNDYKFYCIDGSVEFIQVVSNRHGGEGYHNYYNVNWDEMPIYRSDYRAGDLIPKPEQLDEAVRIAKVLSSKFTFVRVDLYIEEKIYFGELTFTPGNGLIRFLPDSIDKNLCSKMRLEIND